jgi:hypothetical protein
MQWLGALPWLIARRRIELTLVSQTLWRLFAGQIRREALVSSHNQYRPDGTAGLI